MGESDFVLTLALGGSFLVILNLAAIIYTVVQCRKKKSLSTNNKYDKAVEEIKQKQQPQLRSREIVELDEIKSVEENVNETEIIEKRATVFIKLNKFKFQINKIKFF